MAKLQELTDTAAGKAGRGQKLETMKVWPRTKELITLASGASGVPKTHLLHQMAEAFLRQQGQLDVLEMIINLRENTGAVTDEQVSGNPNLEV